MIVSCENKDNHKEYDAHLNKIYYPSEFESIFVCISLCVISVCHQQKIIKSDQDIV